MIPDDPELDYGYFWGSPSFIGNKTELNAIQKVKFPTYYSARSKMNEQLAAGYSMKLEWQINKLLYEALDVMIELADTGMTMIVVTHEMGFAKTIADRVIFMDEGDIVEENEPNEFFNNPQHERTKLFLSQIL